MSKKARSARGELVDFDLLAIKQQLATLPVPVSVDQRRRFIDEKDGVKHRPSAQKAAEVNLVDGPLSMSYKAATESAGDDNVYSEE